MSAPRSHANTERVRVLRSNYRVLGLIGQGQFGKVYCATHRKSGKLVALKSLDRYRQSTQQFLRELRFLLSLRHRNIVACQALENTRRGRYLVMDYCPGGTLRELLEDDQCQVNWYHGLKLILDVLKGLAHAHAQNIIHCDIKPENILLEPTTQGWVARITDFGVAHVIQEAGSGDSGSPAYMAPERFYGQYHLSSDLYAVGIILFELLTGERPFSGTPLELRNAHLNQSPVIPSTLPPGISQVLRQSLKKLPGQRFQSAQSMADALERSAQELSFTPTPQQSPYFRWSADVPPQQLLPLPIATLKLPSKTSVYALCPGTKPEDGLKLYWTQEHEVYEYTHSGDRQADPSTVTISAERSTALGEKILEIHPSHWGVWLVTERGIYLWPTNQNQATLVIRWQNSHTRFLSIDPSQRWFAATSALADRPLLLGSLSPRFHQIRTYKPTIDPLQVFALSIGHGVILGMRQEKPWLEAFNRRGKTLGDWPLPINLCQGILGTRPYRLVGTECGLPHLIFLDFKPYRLRRIHLPDLPQSITRFSWGYGVSSDRQLFMLDTEGRLVGQWEDFGPVPPTLRSLWDRQLAAFQTNAQETIVRIWDIDHLNLDMIF